MREAAFVRQNKDKWTTFETALTNDMPLVPEVFSDLYVEITDDLSYTRTFYPGSGTEAYLNGLAGRAHGKLYRTRKLDKNRILRFWKEEFPAMYHRYHIQLAISFCAFCFFVVIGLFSAAHDRDFTRLVLGDGYVNMTLENIAQGDPMAVYKQMGELNMFLGITINNIKVALIAFLYGIMLGIGTLFVLMQNGIMLGSFQYIFYENGLLWDAIRTIWIHGTIEISAIIIAGSAGLVMADGILFPGTYTRLESFKRAVKDGLKIMLSTVPFFIVAGFLEGFVTRNTQMPDVLAIGIIVGSLSLIVYYYIVYPLVIKKRPGYGKAVHRI